MGIAISRKRNTDGRSRLARILVLALVFVATGVGIFLANVQQASAQITYKAAWVNDRTIKLNVTITTQGRGGSNTSTADFDYIDSNPNDTNRTFRQQNRPATKCAADKTSLITLGSSPASGTLYTIGAFPGCAVASQSISIGALSSALIDTTNCADGRGGTAEMRCEEDKADGNAQFARSCGPPYPSGPLCVATGAPPYAQNPTPGEEQNTNDREPHPCDSLGDFSLRWITCPILTAGVEFTEKADALIEGQLHYGVDVFDTSTAAGKNFKGAWNTFRTVGMSLILIVGLIMVVSQAANLQIFDAYAFRKTLPRLLIAVIGIALSWEILEFVIVFFNDLGHWVQDLVLTPFQNEADPTSSNPFAKGAGFALVVSGALLGTAAGAITLGPLGIISLIITVIMAIAIGLFVLMTRSAIITLAIITAPLAIACWVLPNTKKVWDFWQNALTTALFIFPIIMLLIAAGKAMSLVASNGIMKILFLVLPYVLLPFAFRLAGGLMQTVFSLTNDKTRGAFDRMSNLRRNQVKNRMDDAVNQTGKTWLSKNTGVAGIVGRPLGSVYRRGRMASEHGIGGIGGATYSAGLQKIRDARAAEALKNDMGRAAGDDDANAIAQEATSSGEFIRQYMARTGHDEGRARAALRTLETGYGAKIGSDAMAVAAFKARGMSGTGYDGSGNYQEATEDAARMVSRGLISTQDAAAVFKANQKRADLNAIGFGSWMGHIDRAAERYRGGARGAALVTADEAATLRSEALEGAMPGQVISGRHETVRALAPQMIENLSDTLAHVDAGGNAVGTDDIALGRELAKIAGRYDAMAQSNPLNAGIMADQVLSHTLVRAAGDSRFVRPDGTAMSVREMIDYYGRSDPDFLTMRREYSSLAGAVAGAGGQQQEGQ